jgi:hypothetical protein
MGQMIQNLKKNNTHLGILWAAELHMSSNFDNCFLRIIQYYLEEINISNTHIIEVINEFINYYISRGEQYPHYTNKMKPLQLESINKWINDQKIRNFIGAIIPMITTTAPIKLPKLFNLSPLDLDMNRHRGTLLTKDLSVISKYLTMNDPKEIIIPFSEINLILKNPEIRKKTISTEYMNKIIFWFQWMQLVDKGKKEGIICEKRGIDILKKRNVDYPNLNCNHLIDLLEKVSFTKKDISSNYMWIFWNIIEYVGLDDFYREGINQLLKLFVFCLIKNKRKLCILCCILASRLVLNPLPFIDETQIKKKKDEHTKLIIKSTLSINYIYLDLLKNKPTLTQEFLGYVEECE